VIRHLPGACIAPSLSFSVLKRTARHGKELRAHLGESGEAAYRGAWNYDAGAIERT